VHNHDAGWGEGSGQRVHERLDRLDHMEKMMSGMLEAVKGTRAALALLYAVFTEEQKKVADQLIRGLIWSWVRCNHKRRSRQRLPTSIPGNDPR
jgi:hypothetical protein